ncbi:hypothetical protein EIP86_009119 [Pleurotus ostreatoroseus]|nr:hypothetical protein EIP86_009119 [Pleurotus ostreatoroseus]
MSAGIPLHERQYNDYVVNIRIDRSQSPGGTLVVIIFLGDVPPDPRQWESAPKVGVATFMGMGGSRERVSQANSANPRIEHGQVSLTNALIDLIESKRAVGAGGDVLRSLDRAEVGPFLRQNLHWKVQSVSNFPTTGRRYKTHGEHHTMQAQNEFPLSEVPSLRVSVATCIATLPEQDDQFVHYGPSEVVGEATQGRPCGFDPDVDRL